MGAAHDMPMPSDCSSVATRRPPTIDLHALRQFPVPQLEAEASAAREVLESRSPLQLRVVTWNVWFDELCKNDRMQALLTELLVVAPDIICLQEVLPELATAFRASASLTELYDISPFHISCYGCLMLARRDLRAHFVEVPYESTCMGRTLLLADCQGRYPGVLVATTHLESLNSEARRRAQLTQAAEALQGRSAAVLCGDFNFDATQTYGDWQQSAPARPREQLENCVLGEVLPDFEDVWPALRSDEGFSFDGAANPKCIQDPLERMRYDRVLVRRPCVRPLVVSLLGTQAINDWGVMPSDHFGVQADLELKL